jgi:hypothetical protein
MKIIFLRRGTHQKDVPPTLFFEKKKEKGKIRSELARHPKEFTRDNEGENSSCSEVRREERQRNLSGTLEHSHSTATSVMTAVQEHCCAELKTAGLRTRPGLRDSPGAGSTLMEPKRGWLVGAKKGLKTTEE